MDLQINMEYINKEKLFLENYLSLGLDEKELVFLLHLVNVQKKNLLTTTEMFKEITKVSTFTISDCEKMAGSLLEYEIMDMIFEEEREICDFSPAIRKILNNKKNEKIFLDDILPDFENEYGRTLSKYELSDLEKWINDGFSKKEIDEAIFKAKRANKFSIKFVDAILYGMINND